MHGQPANVGQYGRCVVITTWKRISANEVEIINSKDARSVVRVGLDGERWLEGDGRPVLVAVVVAAANMLNEEFKLDE